MWSTLSAMAWRNLWRHARRSIITAATMAVAASMCMAALAINAGVYGDIYGVMVDQQLGHVAVQHPDYPARRQLYDTVGQATQRIRSIQRVPHVAAVSARLQSHGLVSAREDALGAQLIGVQPSYERLTSGLDERVVAGDWLPDDASAQVVVGRGLADKLSLEVGDELVVVTQAADGSTGNALYRVSGVVRTGDVALDRAGVLMHLDDLQELLVLPDQVHRITVLATDRERIAEVADGARDAVPDDLLVQPWWVASPQTAQMLDMQAMANVMILGVVFTVAAFGVVNTMTMSVFERTRELGVLRALGMRPARLVALVVLESLFLGGLAMVGAAVLGGALDWYLVVYGLDYSASMEEGFSFSGVTIDPVMKGKVVPGDVAMVLGSIVVVSVLASLWPATRAARLRPVEAIRSE